MKKNEELFFLIKSLSKSEKRYFKVSTPHTENAEYLQLFDAIDRQKTFDEVAIKALFKDKAFVHQLTTIKNYLKNKILQSLRSFHSKLSVNTELLDIIRNVEVLYHKGLYTICFSELLRAEKKAKHFENSIILFHILDWKRKVSQAIAPQDFETMETIVTKQKETLESAKEYTDLLLANINPNQFSISHKQASSLQNKTLKTLHKYRKLLNQNASDKAKQVIEEILREWEAQPSLLKEFFTMYFATTNNLLGLLVYKALYKEAFVQILKIKQKAKANAQTSASFIKEQLRLYNIELEIHRKLNEIHTTLETIEEIKEFLNEHSSLVPESYQLSFRFQFATIFFFKKDYKASLHWINEILNRKHKKDRKDLILYTHWLNLLIHYEMGNGFTLRYLISNLRKLIRKQRNIEPYEQMILKFLSSTVDLTQPQRKKSFITLNSNLAQNPIPEVVIGYLDFYQWIINK